MPAEAPPSATRYRAASAALAIQAAREALRARGRGLAEMAAVLVRYQMIAAVLAEAATGRMLEDQPGRTPEPDAVLNPPGFTTQPDTFERLVADIEAEQEREFQRLVTSLVQESARAAQQVAVTARDGVHHVRHLTLPSCSRCAVLAGRVYRYSEGFQRHPGCDCTMTPVTVASPDLTYDPVELARSGQVTGLSRADLRAIDQGADFNQVVNVRSSKAGLTESGRVLARRGRLTPQGIYRQAGDDRDAALALLRQHGYLR